MNKRHSGRCKVCQSPDRSEIERMLEDGEWGEILDATMKAIRGTVQADILKEDQALEHLHLLH
jgi:hypothetical protein